MSGIVAARVPGGAAPFLLTALARLGHRGYDSAGVAVGTVEGGTATLRTTARIGDLRRQVEDWSGTQLGAVGIGHTRWATRGGVSVENAHPHRDCAERISVVHNGVVENADSLRTRLQTEGHLFRSDVDSEVICHLVEAELERDPDLRLAVERTVAQLLGSWALVVLHAESGAVVAASERSPLVVARSDHGDFVASDIGAIAEWVREYVPLRDGDVVALGPSWTWTNHGRTTVPPASSSVGRADPSLELGGHEDSAGPTDVRPPIETTLPDGVDRGADALG